MESGPLAGYPMVDFRATLTDGSFHEVDSNEMAFKIAASLALKDGVRRAGAVLMEPIMRIDVTTPKDYLGDVMGDLMRRRGKIESQDNKGNVTIIHGNVPLKEMFGYATTLRSLSQGRASYSMEPSHYEEAPRNIQEEIVQKYQGAVAAGR